MALGDRPSDILELEMSTPSPFESAYSPGYAPAGV